MFIKHNLFITLVVASMAPVLRAGPVVYAVDSFAQFGTVDLATGAFHQTGTFTLPGGGGLSSGPSGGLLSLGFAGDLYSVNPANGVGTLIGATGLSSCAQPGDSCGSSSANALVSHAGTTYATDFANKIYTVDTSTGNATLLGSTGIPAVPFIPQTGNPDGSFNFFDESLFSIGGNLYATFDAGTFNPATFEVTAVIPAALYRIDPSTGHGTLIGPTDLGLHAVVGVNGTAYAFNAATHQVFTLDLTTGQTAFLSDLDPGVGLIAGAAAIPEPGSVWLSVFGMAAIVVMRRRKRCAR